MAGDIKEIKAWVWRKDLWVVTGFIDKRVMERFLVEAKSEGEAKEYVITYLKDYAGKDYWFGKGWELSANRFSWDDDSGLPVWCVGFGEWE